MLFKDRIDAAKQLAIKIKASQTTNTLVVGIASGGIPLAQHIAKELSLPEFFLQVKKIRSTSHDHVAIGAMSENGITMFNDALIELLKISQEFIQQELEEIKTFFDHHKRDLPDFKNQHILLVDDGIATGITMKVAIASLFILGAEKIQIASPVVSVDALRFFEKHIGEMIYLARPMQFNSLEEFYKSFPSLEEQGMDILSK